MKININKSTVLKFILLIGIVNMFADMTYEGARSVVGAFLGSLGASAAIVSTASGIGEFLGYSLRSVSGYIADKTHKYWVVAFIGYAVNMLAVPALALAGNWPIAAALIIAERTGRAIRRPSVEAMLSYTAKEVGSGKVFGINEALDQTGATIGPLIVALVLYLKGGYKGAFGILLFSALLCLGTLLIARVLYPNPRQLAKKEPVVSETGGFSSLYWLYVGAGALIAAGFADFSLIAFHFQKIGSVDLHVIPLLYALAMASGAVTALIFGRLYDRIGLPAVFFAFFLGALSIPLVFLGQFLLILVGMILWGIGLGAQDTLLKAVLSDVVSLNKRGTAFGLFDTVFGFSWLLGNIIVGILYDKSLLAVIIVSAGLQLASLPIFFFAKNYRS